MADLTKASQQKVIPNHTHPVCEGQLLSPGILSPCCCTQSGRTTQSPSRSPRRTPTRCSGRRSSASARPTRLQKVPLPEHCEDESTALQLTRLVHSQIRRVLAVVLVFRGLRQHDLHAPQQVADCSAVLGRRSVLSLGGLGVEGEPREHAVQVPLPRFHQNGAVSGRQIQLRKGIRLLTTVTMAVRGYKLDRFGSIFNCSSQSDSA